MKIPAKALKEYVEAGVIAEYDVSHKKREQHDREAEEKRKKEHAQTYKN